jgi:hypothetical protein
VNISREETKRISLPHSPEDPNEESVNISREETKRISPPHSPEDPNEESVNISREETKRISLPHSPEDPNEERVNISREETKRVSPPHSPGDPNEESVNISGEETKRVSPPHSTEDPKEQRRRRIADWFNYDIPDFSDLPSIEDTLKKIYSKTSKSSEENHKQGEPDVENNTQLQPIEICLDRNQESEFKSENITKSTSYDTIQDFILFSKEFTTNYSSSVLPPGDTKQKDGSKSAHVLRNRKQSLELESDVPDLWRRYSQPLLPGMLLREPMITSSAGTVRQINKKMRKTSKQKSPSNIFLNNCVNV